MNRYLLGGAAALALAACGVAQAGPSHCSLFDGHNPAGRYFDGPCAVADSATTGGYTATLRMGKTVLPVHFSDHQGQWSHVILKDRPGMCFEQDRYTYRCTSADLTVAVDFSLPH